MVEYKNPKHYYIVAYEVFCDRRIFSFGKSPHLVILTTFIFDFYFKRLKKFQRNLTIHEIYITKTVTTTNQGRKKIKKLQLSMTMILPIIKIEQNIIRF